MANQAVSLGSKPFTVECSQTNVSIAIESDRDYTITHLGKDSAGSVVSDDVFVGVTAAPTATYAADPDKLVLQPGVPRNIGPLLTQLNFKMAAGKVAVVNVTPGAKFNGAD